MTSDVRRPYTTRPGRPFDRGAADSWYGRPFNPHYFVGTTNMSEKVEMAQMTAAEIAAYTAGYRWNEDAGGKKDYGDGSEA